MKLSLLGKIAAMKMIILPKVLFLLQTIPVVKDIKHFESWQKKINNFLWDGKKACIKRKYLMNNKSMGGLQLPNFRFYFEAVCLTWIGDWIRLTNEKLLNLEGCNKRYGWHSFLLYDKLKVDSLFSHHFIRSSLIKVWQRYVCRLDTKRLLWISPLQVLDLTIKYTEERIFTYQDFIETVSGKFQMKALQNFPLKVDWYQYYQMKALFEEDNKKYGFREKKNQN